MEALSSLCVVKGVRLMRLKIGADAGHELLLRLPQGVRGSL